MFLIRPKRNSYQKRRLYASLVGTVLLVIFGVSYRFLQAELRRVSDKPIKLKIALSNFPMQVGPWEGQDVPIPKAIQRVARNDDFVSRRYVNQRTSQWFNLYIAFSARPRTMLGHRPELCYPASGWQHDRTEHIEITRSQSGLIVPCLFHHFSMPPSGFEKIVVLNYYVLNGVITDTESGFFSLSGRSPNLQGDMAKYVSQVQISSELENSVLLAAEEFTDLILTYFPDEKGEIQAEKGNRGI